MTNASAAKLAVLGSPIAHSLSPALHTAAYRQLQLPWTYEAIEVDAGSLEQFVTELGPQWRGLSLTMPLKRNIVPLLDSSDRVVGRSGVANTVLVNNGLTGFNTDVAGIVRAFQQNGVHRLNEVMVLGGGATAISAMLATVELGARLLKFWVRDPLKSGEINRLSRELGVEVEIYALMDIEGDDGTPDAVVSTIPNGSVVDLVFSPLVRRSSVLFDVAYDPWPSTLAQSWMAAGWSVISGIDMLINQALLQVRIFVGGNPEIPLPEEADVFAAMRAALSAA